MAHPPETRKAVRDSYVVGKLTLEDAADRHDVPFDTARKWKSTDAAKGEDWDKARSAHSLTASGAGTIAQLVLHDFLAMYQDTVEAVKGDTRVSAMQRADTLAKLADAFQKTISAVAKAAPDLGRYAVATELLSDLAAFVAAEFPDHRAAFVEILEPFGAFVAKKYG
ncbi:MAG TPA: DUF1804 family protein [Candidatus Omnitrophota bacterium]|nr:DUF1804 family protein [Candidatus Omnitrophota bacterium]